MSDITPDPTLTTTQARSKLAVAHMGDNPDPDTLRLLKANLACANIDRRVRKELAAADLHPVHIGHLVGLLLAEAHVDGTTVALVEKLARDAAAAVLAGGNR